MDVLEELRGRWMTSEREGRDGEEKMAAVEAKCEELEEKLANAR